MNKVILCGNLGADVELKQIQGGKAVASFRLATNDGKEPEWHTIVAWEKTAELCGQFLHKGSRVLIDGSIKTRSWEADGVKHQRTEIVAFRVEFLDPKRANGSPQGQGYGSPQGGGGYGAPAQQGYGAPQGGYGQPQGHGYGAPQGAPAQGGGPTFGPDDVPF